MTQLTLLFVKAGDTWFIQR